MEMEKLFTASVCRNSITIYRNFNDDDKKIRKPAVVDELDLCQNIFPRVPLVINLQKSSNDQPFASINLNKNKSKNEFFAPLVFERPLVSW